MVDSGRKHLVGDHCKSCLIYYGDDVLNIMSEEDKASSSDNEIITIALGFVLAGLAYGYSRKKGVLPVERDLLGKTFVVTGGNCGIGKATAHALVSRGATVALGCRNTDAGSKARTEILASIPVSNEEDLEVLELDLNSWGSIHTFPQRLQQLGKFERGLYCLINNAGAIMPEYSEKGGLEMTMRTNFLGPLGLTMNLLPQLRRYSAGAGAGAGADVARIVNVTSRLEKNSKLSDIELANGPTGCGSQQNYSPMAAYSDSKHAQLLGSLGLAKKLEASEKHNIIVHAVTPGMVSTSLSRYLSTPVQWLVWPLQRMLLQTPEQGAMAVVHSATSRETRGETGQYYSMSSSGDFSKVFDGASERSRNEKLAQSLVENSMTLIARSDSDKDTVQNVNKTPKG